MKETIEFLNNHWEDIRKMILLWIIAMPCAYVMRELVRRAKSA